MTQACNGCQYALKCMFGMKIVHYVCWCGKLLRVVGYTPDRGALQLRVSPDSCRRSVLQNQYCGGCFEKILADAGKEGPIKFREVPLDTNDKTLPR